MVKKLDALGVDGSRGINVISVLSKNTEKLRQQQNLANQSLQEGTSVVEEYNIRNNNLAGQLEKTGKKIEKVSAVFVALIFLKKINLISNLSLSGGVV
jgi:hypothetical protein